MNEKKLVKISLLGFLVCMSMLYILTLSGFQTSVNIGEIDKSYIGESVNVSGEIKGLFTHDGHLFFDLDDGTGKIKVVLWRDTLEVMKNRGIEKEYISDGNEINLIGNVHLYMGELELLPTHGNVYLIK